MNATLHPYGVDERVIALDHGPSLRPTDLLWLDRGYPAFWFWAGLRWKGVPFCARVTHSTWTAVQEFRQSGREEQQVTLRPTTGAARTKCREYGLSTQPLTVRLLRIVLPSGEEQILMTTLLDAAQFPHALFADLYHRRWGIEEDFKEMKSRLPIENFTGKSVHSVYQDFHAKILALNLKAVLAFSAQPEVDARPASGPYRRQVNHTYALSCLKHQLVRIFGSSSPGEIIQPLLLLFQRTLEPIRPNRHSPRKPVIRSRPTFFPAYKPTC